MAQNFVEAVNSSPRLNICLALNPANRSWIIEKIAEKLAGALTDFGDNVAIVEDPANGFDIVHHMSWAFARQRSPSPSTMFITHLDDIYKMNEVRSTLKSYVDVGLCMSRDTMNQLTGHGVPQDAVRFISPAHDPLAVRRRIVVGITSRVYKDGRKREGLLIELSKRMDLGNFEFQIFGAGWNHVVDALRRAGSTVLYSPGSSDYGADYQDILSALERFDYYLYLGMDEGSLGTLDALCAGVATIVTPQGFHLDLQNGITHAVISIDDLERTFREIERPLNARRAAVAGLDWRTYALQHRAVWSALAEGRTAPVLAAEPSQPAAVDFGQETFRRQAIYSNALDPKRVLSALSHTLPFSLLRRVLRGRAK